MWDKRLRSTSAPCGKIPGHEDIRAGLQSGQEAERRLPVVVDHVTKAEAAMNQGSLFRPPPEGHEFPPAYDESRPRPPRLDTLNFFSDPPIKTMRSTSLGGINNATSISVKDRIALFSRCGSNPCIPNGSPMTTPLVPSNPLGTVSSTTQRTKGYPPPVTVPPAPKHPTPSPPSPLNRWHSTASLLTTSTDRRPSYVSAYPETQLLRRTGYERSSSAANLLTSFLQERRSSSSSKLKGLVIPQGPAKPAPTTTPAPLPVIGPSASWKPAPLVQTNFQLSHSKPVTPLVPERPVLVSPIGATMVQAPPPLPPTSPPPLPPTILNPVQTKQTLSNFKTDFESVPSTTAESGLTFRNPIERLDSLLGGRISTSSVQLSTALEATPIFKSESSPVTSISSTAAPITTSNGHHGPVSMPSPLSPPLPPAQRTQSAPNPSPSTADSSTSRARFWSLRDDSDDDSNSVISLRTEDSRQTADDSLSDADSLHQERSEFRPRRLSQQRTVLSSTVTPVSSKQVLPTDSVRQFRALAEKWESRSITTGSVAVSSPTQLSVAAVSTPPPLHFQSSGASRSPKSPAEISKLPPSLQPRSNHEAKPALSSLERSLSSLDLMGSRLQKNSRSVSVSDIRKSFETKKQVSEHKRFSSMDSTASDSGVGTPGGLYGSASSLLAGTPSRGGCADSFGSATSLASEECSLLATSASPSSTQDVHYLMEEAATFLGGDPSLGNHRQLTAVVLHKDTPQSSVGITLAGGADYEVKEITVHKVICGSLADRDGGLCKGDRIISINGRILQGMSHREALDLLKAHQQEVILVICRNGSKDVPLAQSEGRPSRSSQVLSLESKRTTSLHSGPAPKLKTAASVVPSPGSPTADCKVDLTASGVAKLHLIKDGAGLGFSLDGGQGSPLGDKPLTVKRVFKGGAADREGHLQVGDQVLFVGNQCVSTMTRTEAWNFMKKLADGPVTLIVSPALFQPEGQLLPN